MNESLGCEGRGEGVCEAESKWRWAGMSVEGCPLVTRTSKPPPSRAPHTQDHQPDHLALRHKTTRPTATRTKQVDLKKVNMDVIRRWISEQLAELVGFEDDVTIMTLINYLESVSDSHACVCMCVREGVCLYVCLQ